MSRLTRFLTLCIFTAVMLGCSQQTDSGVLSNAGLDAALPVVQLPALPDERMGSVMMDFTQLGMQAALRDLNAWDEGTSLRLASSTASMVWGIWGFGSAADATTCVVDFSGEAGSKAYFAISDYSTGAWEFGGPLSGPQQVITIDDPRYSNGNGDLYIVVIAYGGANILVDQLRLTADISPIQTSVDFTGGYTSLAMVNGRPAISFYADADHDLRYVHATDYFGSNWGVSVVVDGTGDTGQYTSLKVVDGYPAIAYYDVTNKDLRYARALDADGATWGVPVTVDGLSVTGEFCSLEVVAGSPAISYYDYDNSELRYVRALDATGATWGAPVSLDNTANTGQETSLEVINGNPAVSYRNGGAGELRFIRATDATGTAWATPVILDSVDNTGFNSSLTVVNGNPALCYYDGTASELRYIRALDGQGSAWGSPQILDGQLDDAGDNCSLAVIDGLPGISYYNGLNGDLHYIQALDASGATWGAAMLLDESSNIIGRDTSLLDVYGLPAVSYYDQTNGVLRYMWGF